MLQMSDDKKNKEIIYINHIKKWLSHKLRNRALSPTSHLGFSIGTTLGKIRNENQDRAIVVYFEDHNKNINMIFAVCDGMGGMLEGAKCAEIALSTFISSILEDYDNNDMAKIMINAAELANYSVHNFAHGNGGATLTATYIKSPNDIVGIKYR